MARDGTIFTEWGTPSAHDYGTARAYPLTDVHSVADVARHKWPDVALYDYEDAAARAKRLSAEYAVRGPYWRPLFCGVCDLMGMEEAMARMAFEPIIFEAVLDRVFEVTLAYCERLLAACGDAMPILCLGDDFATQRGLMISPEHWRRYLRPRYEKLFSLAKHTGRYVWFHSCGDISSVLPDLIDIGMDVWETVQLHTLPMSAEELKREYGRHITFFGGVNTQQLPFAKPEDVQVEVRRCIETLGRDGGYICGPDHHVKPDVSVENTLALFKTATAYRGYGYTLLSE